MRQVKRSIAAPKSLNKATVPKGSPVGTAATTELQRAAAHFALPLPSTGKRPAFDFEAYKLNVVKTRLMQEFHHKCAYCESHNTITAPIDVEHYRPKGRIKEEPGHEGYWWLAMSWENLLPSCINCNRHQRHKTPTQPKKAGVPLQLNETKGMFSHQKVLKTGKQDAFPIDGNRIWAPPPPGGNHDSEKAVLINPCTDNPEDFLEFYIDLHAPLGVVLPKAQAGTSTLAHLTPVEQSKSTAAIRAHAISVNASERGAVSIQTYGLNRLQLVRERTRVLRRLEYLGYQLQSTAELITELETPIGHAACDARTSKAVVSLKKMLDMTASEIKNMASTSSPYSVMVQTWLSNYCNQVRSGAPIP
jgi:uncharacterized protein (TIGR02646 family)